MARSTACPALRFRPNLELLLGCRLSGRTEARSGLRMMPTFPPSPLRFRTAGFPQYGSKAGMSDRAFPMEREVFAAIGLPLSFVLSAAIGTPCSVSGTMCL